MVDDGKPRSMGRFAVEEHLLGGEIAIHVAVEIQVVPGQVREHCGFELYAVNPAQTQRMRGGLHRHVRAAGLLQFGEQLEQIERLGRGVDGRQATPRQPVLDGTDQRGRQPRGEEDGVDQVCGCGFSVCARYAVIFSRRSGWLIEVAGHGRESLPAMRDPYPDSLESLAARETR